MRLLAKPEQNSLFKGTSSLKNTRINSDKLKRLVVADNWKFESIIDVKLLQGKVTFL